MFILVMIITACHPNQGISIKSDKYGYTVYEHDSAGILIYTQHYSKDSLPWGEKILYYNKGKINKWYWYQKNEKYPEIIITYDFDNTYNSYKGTPYLSSESLGNSHILVKLVIPPYVSFEITYLAIESGVITRSKKYFPTRTDSISYLTIDHYFEPNKVYYLKTVFFDKYNVPRDSMNIELER
jgi:hypothetical protein